MDFDKLRADDPGGTMQTAFDALRVMTVDVLHPLSASQLNKWAAANNARKLIMMAADDYTSPAYELAAAAKSALENINSNLDLSDPEVIQMLGGLVQAGLITVPAREDLLARATTTELKYPGLTIGQIEYVRVV